MDLEIPSQQKAYEDIQKKEIRSLTKDVRFIFEINPELSVIGTSEQYLQYIESIFPESKKQEVVYHGTNKFEGDEFDIAKSRFGVGFYFADREYLKWDKRGEKVIPVKINANYKSVELPRLEFMVPRAEIEEKRKAIKEGYNSLKVTNQDKSQEYYIVFNSGQIHIFGSKPDLLGFKEFIKNNNVPFEKKDKKE